MADTLYLCVGQAGCSIGSALLSSLNPDNFRYFHSQNRPNFVFADSEPRVISTLSRHQNLRSFFGSDGASTNWALGFSQDELVESTIDGIRGAIESLDTLSSIVLTSSIMGGSGGGLMSSVVNHEDFPRVSLPLISPIALSNTTPLHSISSVLSLHVGLDYFSSCSFFDNDRLFFPNDRKMKRLGVQDISFSCINKSIAQFITHYMSPIGFFKDAFLPNFTSSSSFSMVASEVFERTVPFMDCFSVLNDRNKSNDALKQANSLIENLVCELPRGVKSSSLLALPSTTGHLYTTSSVNRVLQTDVKTLVQPGFTSGLSLFCNVGICTTSLLHHSVRAKRAAISGAYMHYLNEFGIEVETVLDACRRVEEVVENYGLTINYGD
ncbi:hypothetical protein RCL1_001420 [Eukaryota sp. TZLM3-RCL]